MTKKKPLAVSGGKAQNQWPQPFFEGPSEWLRFESSNGSLHFKATKVMPARARSDYVSGCRHPLLVYFPGLGSESFESDFKLSRISELIRSPIVLVSAKRHPGYWWCLDDASEWGFIDGCFEEKAVDLFADWIETLIELEGIDAKRVAGMGFSAGAYMLTELLANTTNRPLLQKLILGGVHGHAQPDMSDVMGKRRSRHQDIVNKWWGYIDRVSVHAGADHGIFIVHNRNDELCPWDLAQKIVKALNEGQRSRKYEAAVVKELDIPTSKKNKRGHCYIQELLCEEVFDFILEHPKKACKKRQELATATPSLAGLPRPPEEPSPAAAEAYSRSDCRPPEKIRKRHSYMSPQAEARLASLAAASSASSFSSTVGSRLPNTLHKHASPAKTAQCSPPAETSEGSSPSEGSSQRQRRMLCANPRCWFLISSDPTFGTFCCKKCHWVWVSKSSTKKGHGHQCERRAAPEDARRADPVPPDVPCKWD
eukprot:TRINITY_DN31436_c0_g1_i1.p1 TRINITY_DN31436_c0_g1~~TRINITY_DN31436_c0_g1_i1.p1  ORF type:complete len:491 (+),score=74.77 TRINITY_DN31436_c0_g1_i1:32-1474(+)